MYCKEMKFDFNDISLIPAKLSDIRSRGEINILDENGKLPIFVSPMDTVVDDDNYKKFLELGMYVCIPRKNPNDFDNSYEEECFMSYGLDEIESMVINNQKLPKRVLIDVANAHSIRVYEISKKIKETYDIELMIGNIANPETYLEYANIGVDYIRCGIGAGQACFIANTQVRTLSGLKNISEINIGDNVLTHSGHYKEVYNIINYDEHDDLIKINETVSTINHKYYVVNKKSINALNNDNIDEYAEWIEAGYLNFDYMLIDVVLSNDNISHRLIDINVIETVKHSGIKVYDLSVKDDESYTANSHIVHNCTTSANSSIHYPMASLIHEISQIRIIELNGKKSPKIIADGGFKNFDDIIKAIGIGADGVMLGSIINKSIESCGDNFVNNENNYVKVSKEEALAQFNTGVDIYKSYRGMSTKAVQKKWGKSELRTSEGISKFNKVEYSIAGWLDNFKDYLKSCMSYQGVYNIKDFIGNADFIFITQNSYYRFKK